LRKLEEKGAKNPMIEKYKEMREWRLKRDKNVRGNLETKIEKNPFKKS